MKCNKYERIISLVLCFIIGIAFFGNLYHSNNLTANAVDYETVIWPVPGNNRITSRFGWRDLNSDGKNDDLHHAVDIGCPIGTNVLAVASGKVVLVQNDSYNSGMGKRVVIYHGNSIYTGYQHLSKINVNVGDVVSQGTIIAKSGNTGGNYAPHLDFHVKINSGDDIQYVTNHFTKNPLDNFLPYDGWVSTNGENVYINSTAYTLPKYDVNPTLHLDFSSDCSKPSGILTPGKAFGISGSISAYPNLNHVWGGVYYRNGDKTDQYCDVNPDSTFYDLSTYFDANIIFNNLPVGYYTYKIEATTTDGQYQCIQSEFQIGEPPPPISYYEVRLDAGGGEVSPGSITVQTDGTYNGLPTPGRYGYDFVGWFDDSGRQVSDGTGIYTNAEHTLYARWSPKPITVYLNANGGLISPDAIQVNFNNNYNNLPDPVRDGYNFAGWFTTADGGSQVDFNSVCNTVNEQTLFAHWDKNKIMITFNAMGGTVETANKLVVYDNKYGVLPTPQKKGYEFKGWYLEENCVNQITSASIVNITGNQSIYAKWELKKYRITFDANGGEVDISSKQVTAEKKYGVLPEPTKSNYRFLGWYTADDTKIISSDTVELSEDTILYAKWQLIGDINSDNTINIADAVRLQNYLLCRLKLNEAEYYAGDINEDGSTDVFDMVCMRRMLIERNGVL